MATQAIPLATWGRPAREHRLVGQRGRARDRVTAGASLRRCARWAPSGSQLRLDVVADQRTDVAHSLFPNLQKTNSMTATATESMPTITTDTWTQQLAQLKARHKHVHEPILVALNILLHNQNIALEDAKAQATLHGVKITAASMNAAQKLLPATPATSAPTTPDAAPAPTATTRPTRRVRAPEPAMDAEALIRGVVSKLQSQGSADAQRLRDAMRKAIAVLEAAVG